MITVELNEDDYYYYTCVGLWLHKDFDLASIDEAVFKRFYPVTQRVGGYLGYVTHEGREVKVIFK